MEEESVLARVLASCRDRERLGDGFYLEVTSGDDDEPTRSPAQFRRQLRLQAAGNAEERQREQKRRRISSEPRDSRDGSSSSSHRNAADEEEEEEEGRRQNSPLARGHAVQRRDGGRRQSRIVKSPPSHVKVKRRRGLAGRSEGRRGEVEDSNPLHGSRRLFDGDVVGMAEEWTDYDGGAVQEWHRNASHIRVASGVTAIPEDAFEGCDDLRAVDLSNVTTISDRAFVRCSSLERVVWTTASAVVEIGDDAFHGCCSLEEIDLGNATKIGAGAFLNCDTLERICIPSTALAITDHAFAGCYQLRHAELQEGLRTNGEGAFRYCCSLERIAIPSSVKSIGSWAFEECSSLTEVTLREGLLDIDADAFIGCTALAHISIPPVALVIDFKGFNCQLMRATLPIPRERTLVISKWLQYRSPIQLAQAQAKVWEILSRPRQPEGQKIALIRKWFAYYEQLDVTTMLELAIWKSNMNGNEQDAATRQASRRNCGGDMNIIIPGVLEYLEE